MVKIYALYTLVAIADSIKKICPCNLHLLTPKSLYSKTGVYRGIHNFLIFALKHRLWELVKIASLRRF